MAFEAFRQRIGSIIGGFDAAQAHRRLRGFRASRAHVNTLIAASGDTITARARWLVRNNGYAANAVESFASNVVGDGIKPSSAIADAAKKEDLQALWLAWTDDADAEGLTDVSVIWPPPFSDPWFLRSRPCFGTGKEFLHGEYIGVFPVGRCRGLRRRWSAAVAR